MILKVAAAEKERFERRTEMWKDREDWKSREEVVVKDLVGVVCVLPVHPCLAGLKHVFLMTYYLGDQGKGAVTLCKEIVDRVVVFLTHGNLTRR